MILNANLFGVDSPLGWRATNLLLHAVVVAMAFGLLRALHLSRIESLAIGLLFAVHPAHVESVAWISGSPDLLMSIGLIGSLWAAVCALQGSRGNLWVWSGIFFAIGLIAKEAAILFPLVIMVAAFAMAPAQESSSTRARGRFAMRVSQWYWLVSLVYFMARLLVLGTLQIPQENSAGWQGTFFTAPLVALFYLRQMLFPHWVAPAHPLRPLTIDNVGITNGLLPLLGVVVILFAAWACVRKQLVGQIGLVLAICVLAPAMHVGVFPRDQIVHDRYLYLPVLGGLIVVIPAVVAGLGVILRDARQAEIICLLACALIAGPRAVATVRYSEVWMNNLDLWRCAVASDPNSAFNQHQLGVFLHQAGEWEPARLAFERSMEIEPRWLTRLGRALLAIDQGRFDDAEQDLREVVKQEDQAYLAYEALAVVHERRGQRPDAIEILKQGRQRIPYRKSSFTEKIAIVLYQMGQRDQALVELEQVRDEAKREFTPGAKNVLYRLGLLYAELGRPNDAQVALREYLAATDRATDRATRQQRQAAMRMLAPSTPAAR
jgi:predicted negative regulator of RcsB-dependent stress response